MAVNTDCEVMRQWAWGLAGEHSPVAGISAACPLVIDIDATLVGVRLRQGGGGADLQEGVWLPPADRVVRPRNRQRGGECAVIVLRSGNAGSNTAADHIEVISRALGRADLGPGQAERPGARRARPEVRRRPSSSSPAAEFPTVWGSNFPTACRGSTTPSPRPPGSRLMTRTVSPGTGWTSLRTADLPDLTGWPAGMQMNRAPRACRRGRAAAFRGRQGYRLTAFATNARAGQLPGLEVRHRLRARCQGTASAAPRTRAWARSPLAGLCSEPCLVPSRGP